ncbi:MAG: phosphate regulon sensor protein PhoR [Pseudomonadota bacterium]
MSDQESRSVATATVVKHVLLIVAGYVIGWINGAPLWGALIAALALLGWHIYNLIKLRTWLKSKRSGAIPYGTGIWPTIYARISHFRERSSVHKQRSRELEDARSEFVHTLPNAAFELNEQFEVLTANAQAMELTDDAQEQLSGPISNHLRQPAFIKYLESGDYADGVILQSAQNPEQTLQCVISDRGREGWLLQLIDITQQIKALKIREDFVANASHELRTPVTVLKGYLEGLADDELDHSMEGPVNAMAEQVRRMEAIIADLLTLNVLESAGPAPTDNPVNIAELLKSIHTDALQSKHCPSEFTLNIESSAQVLGDEVELRSVITNLVSNALRFTPQEGRILITWQDAADEVELRVEDNGIGIHEDDIPRITERFYRTVPGRNRHQFGTGLGLAIVKHALARHDSELTVDSELGSGSVFCCRFPSSRIRRG